MMTGNMYHVAARVLSILHELACLIQSFWLLLLFQFSKWGN